jgi:hypothetical protein
LFDRILAYNRRGSAGLPFAGDIGRAVMQVVNGFINIIYRRLQWFWFDATNKVTVQVQSLKAPVIKLYQQL